MPDSVSCDVMVPSKSQKTDLVSDFTGLISYSWNDAVTSTFIHSAFRFRNFASYNYFYDF